MVKALVEKGVKPDFGVVTVMYMAIEQGYFDIAKYLTESLNLNISRMDDDKGYYHHFSHHISYMHTLFNSSYSMNSHGYVGSHRRMVHFFNQRGARLEELIDFRGSRKINYGLLQSQSAATLWMYRDQLCHPGSHKRFCHSDIGRDLLGFFGVNDMTKNYALANVGIELLFKDFHPSWLTNPHPYSNLVKSILNADIRVVNMVLQRLGNLTTQNLVRV